ncbi:MAG TPA: SDR family oxidoreductase [Candidatus Dormibacteraeota bacterium]|nr:SDR family oxidoreductase [Candidatus Dormibacteraeota bacterium]
MSPWKGKCVLVTGGGSGLGRAMAQRFAAEGAAAVVLGRREEPLRETVRLIEEAGGRAHAVSCDVRAPEQVESAIAYAVEREGRLDVLVNNAAGNFICPSERLSPNGFKAVVDIVLSGGFNCARFAFEHLQRTGGSILNIVATYAWLAEPGVVHSAAAKAGLLAMTRTLAAEWGPFGIRVNAIAPGPVHTEGTDKNLWLAPELESTVVGSVPLGRMGRPRDVADAALWLSGAEASWVTGTCLTVDGGQWLSAGVYNFRAAYEKFAGGDADGEAKRDA